MLTLAISFLLGGAVGCGLGFSHACGWGWSIFWGVLTFAASMAGMSLILRSRMKKIIGEMQAILADGQRHLQQRAQQLQFRPSGNVKQMLQEMERVQRPYLERALEKTKAFEPYHRWGMMLARQTDTMRMQLHYQMRNYAEVDRLLPRCIVLDPMTAAMKLARMHVRKDPGQDKFFEKQVSRLRYGDGALLYSLQAWSLVQRGDIPAAHAVLVRAGKKMENAVIARNAEELANNRAKHFSNAGLGDEWYALGLETPRVKMQRPRGPMAKPR
ncbi:MAG: hypothetical protein ACOX5G_04685 [Kiritimatiellia bacterium]|jgi:hypothetical protein